MTRSGSCERRARWWCASRPRRRDRCGFRRGADQHHTARHPTTHRDGVHDTQGAAGPHERIHQSRPTARLRRRRHAPARRAAAPDRLRRDPLLPGASGPVGRPAAADRRDGLQHRGDLRRLELPPTPAPQSQPARLHRRRRRGGVHRSCRRPGTRRPRAAGAVHLRGVGVRWAARMAAGRRERAPALQPPLVHRCGRPLVLRPVRTARPHAGDERRPGRRRPGGERVRELRQRHDATCPTCARR